MSTTIAGAEVRRYLEAVRAHLADLGPDEREEMLEDLEEHLLEVAAEDDGTLQQRLGPPDVYAEELRVSAGLPSRGRMTHHRVAEWARPATIVVGATQLVRWGRRSRRFHIALALAVILAAGIVIGRTSVSPYVYLDETAGFDGTSSLQNADGTTIANICPYSAEGKLLSGVLLFDQSGRPIINSADNADGRMIEQANPAIRNVYPKSISYVDVRDIYDPLTDQMSAAKTLTPLECPAAVTAGPAQPSPVPTAGP